MSAAHFIDEPRPRESFNFPSGRIMDPHEAVLLWHEIAAGQWHPVDGLDLDDTRVAWLIPGRRFPIDWDALSDLEREVLELLATNHAQKFIALKLGLSPTRVSEAARVARIKVGVDSLHILVRAFCVAGRRSTNQDWR